LSPGHGSSGDTADPLSELLTLREFVARGAVPWQFPAAKKRLQRTPAERTPTVAGQSGQANLYRLGDLIAWAESEMVP
jgi:hypothetical protein